MGWIEFSYCARSWGGVVSFEGGFDSFWHCRSRFVSRRCSNRCGGLRFQFSVFYPPKPHRVLAHVRPGRSGTSSWDPCGRSGFHHRRHVRWRVDDSGDGDIDYIRTANAIQRHINLREAIGQSGAYISPFRKAVSARCRSPSIIASVFWMPMIKTSRR